MVGARPVPDALGRVNKVEAVPLEELGRPRVDVVVNCSGVFRDLFINQVRTPPPFLLPFFPPPPLPLLGQLLGSLPGSLINQVSMPPLFPPSHGSGFHVPAWWFLAQRYSRVVPTAKSGLGMPQGARLMILGKEHA